MFFILLILSLLSNEILSVEEFICENTNLNIECPKQTILHIENAVYGRHNSTICPGRVVAQNTNCSSSNATQILQQRCNGKENCTLFVSNNIFTDPCVRTYKYLEFNYTCESPLLQPICGPNEMVVCTNPCIEEHLAGTCSGLCIKTCACENGYIKDNKTGRCIAEQYAPLPGPACKTHEVFSECGAGCEKTCTNRYPFCILLCVPGYVCAENYVRDPTTQRCVHPRDCPVKSPINSNNCSGLHEEVKCVNRYYREFCNSPINRRGYAPLCKGRCVCQGEYTRDPKTRKCIAQQYCPLLGSESETHEVYSECGAGCQPTCKNRNPVCNRLCVAGYVCANGYIRDSSTRQCIRPNQCPAQ